MRRYSRPSHSFARCSFHLRCPARRVTGVANPVAQAMPLLGHRNWILIVDSAYPLQSSPGIETVETNAGQLEVVRHVLAAIDRSIHVRPVIHMDAELPFVPENDAPGVSTYRTEIHDLLQNYEVTSLPHDQFIADIEDAVEALQHPGPQNQSDHALHFGLHPPRLQILERRRRKAPARQNGCSRPDCQQ